MQSFILRWSFNIFTVASLMMIYLIFTNRNLPSFTFDATDLQNFKILFLSIILEAFPFILLGVIVAALLQVFVSDDTVKRFVPRNPVLGILFGTLLGLFFPLCECGMIPVVRRLILKGMPVYIGMIYILAGPILNPVVYASTFMAFRSRPEMAYSRMALAFAVAAAVGFIIYKFVKESPLKQALAGNPALSGLHTHDHIDSHHHTAAGNSKTGKWFAALGHASDEFFAMGKYLMFGALLTALIQTSVSRETLIAIGGGEWSSHVFMMGFAYLLSLCSTSDAFVASSFLTTFSAGSLLTFLVFGPMLDLKNTLMMLAVFRARFVALFSILIIACVLIGSILIERFIFM